jgi:uncharacterized membrane-anchored protein YhcB (DUF1043 family)
MLYKIKSNKDLFDKWTKIAKKTSKHLNSISFIQNDMEVSKNDMNKWYHESLEDIQKMDQDFKDTIQEMLKIRQEIIKDIKNQIK